jgi:hypothetical protein
MSRPKVNKPNTKKVKALARVMPTLVKKNKRRPP